MTQPAWPYPSDPPPDPFAVQVPGPLHIPSLSDLERDAMLTDLRLWVAQLQERFHINTRVIPPCWELHGGMVEALQALRDLERDCYSDKAPPSAAVDWFRGFREIEARLAELAAITSCSPLEHRDPTARWNKLQQNPPEQPA